MSLYISLVDLKIAQHESGELSFNGAKMWTAAWEISDSTENLLQETRGRSVYVLFWKRMRTCNQVHIFQKFSPSHEEWLSP